MSRNTPKFDGFTDGKQFDDAIDLAHKANDAFDDWKAIEQENPGFSKEAFDKKYRAEKIFKGLSDAAGNTMHTDSALSKRSAERLDHLMGKFATTSTPHTKFEQQHTGANINKDNRGFNTSDSRDKAYRIKGAWIHQIAPPANEGGDSYDRIITIPKDLEELNAGRDDTHAVIIKSARKWGLPTLSPELQKIALHAGDTVSQGQLNYLSKVISFFQSQRTLLALAVERGLLNPATATWEDVHTTSSPRLDPETGLTRPMTKEEEVVHYAQVAEAVGLSTTDGTPSPQDIVFAKLDKMEEEGIRFSIPTAPNSRPVDYLD